MAQAEPRPDPQPETLDLLARFAVGCEDECKLLRGIAAAVSQGQLQTSDAILLATDMAMRAELAVALTNAVMQDQGVPTAVVHMIGELAATKAALAMMLQRERQNRGMG